MNDRLNQWRQLTHMRNLRTAGKYALWILGLAFLVSAIWWEDNRWQKIATALALWLTWSVWVTVDRE